MDGKGIGGEVTHGIGLADQWVGGGSLFFRLSSCHLDGAEQKLKPMFVSKGS